MWHEYALMTVTTVIVYQDLTIVTSGSYNTLVAFLIL